MNSVDVKELRARLHLSQSQFAEKFGLNVLTLQQWEQGRRDPDHLARVLLAVISYAPDTVSDAVKASRGVATVL